MNYKKILITGGAGFVGSNLAISFKQHHSDLDIIALDNLKRRGSELNLPRLKKAGIKFIHGDVRHLSDLTDVGGVDLLIECSAEPSVLAGLNGQTDYQDITKDIWESPLNQISGELLKPSSSTPCLSSTKTVITPAVYIRLMR